MEAIRQSVRPKHQMLILKCFPKLPKNSSADEIKPKGSELSYLLYYASSRRSKLTKVGIFLEKKTLHDLGKGRTAPVQITLQILSAFLNNPTIGGTGAQGFGLFAPFVLRIIRDVLAYASEAGLVEAAVPTWDSFCKHQDPTALSADTEFRNLFAEVVKLWAAYATKEQTQPNRTISRRARMKVGVADNVKLRMSGLRALKCTADSEALASESGRQLATVIPVVLQNLYDGDGDLDHIVQLSAQMDAQEKEKGHGRPSTATTRDEDDKGDPRAAGRSVAEADRMADQEASILALRCLKSLFAFENRPQVRVAADQLLRFTLDHRPNPIRGEAPNLHENQEDEWAIRLFQTVCTWIPVQDRFVALFAATDLLTTDRANVIQGDVYRQLLLAKIISRLLAAEINLIGIAVLDVLLGLLRLIVSIIPEEPASTANGSAKEPADQFTSTLPVTPLNSEVPVINGERKLPIRSQLVLELRRCISNLAVHVYYTDQISDMVLSILPRMRPSSKAVNVHGTPRPSSSMAEDGSPPVSDAGASSSGHRDDSHASRASAVGFFFNTAAKREIGLNAVHSILLRSNETSKGDGDLLTTDRNAVPMAAWEGSQWMLKDPSANVRCAYVRAFGAWLDLELPKLTLDKVQEKRSDSDLKRKSLNSDLARRAANTASARKAAGKRSQTAILQSIHLMTVDILGAMSEDPPSTTDNANLKPTTTPPSELQDLAEKLSAVSTRLELMDLEEFRSTQVPSLPLHLSSPKQGYSSLSPHRHPPASDSDAEPGPSRQASSAATSFAMRPGPGLRTRSTSAVRRSPSLGAHRPGSSAGRHAAELAAFGGTGTGQVEELKRLLSASASRASLHPSVGAGKTLVARRAVSVATGTRDDASESMVEFEGSWAGSSILVTGRQGGPSAADVRALLDMLPSGEEEGRGGAGPPS